MKQIDLLIPVYNESENIPRLYSELIAVLNGLANYKFMITFIDDGSQDRSTAVIEDLASRDPRVGLIELSRNFGKEAALSAGINASIGDAVIMLDADLQHPPALIPLLIQKWEAGYEIVSTRRKYEQPPSLVKRLGSHFFYRIMDWISETEMIAQSTDFRLIDERVVEVVQRLTERNRMVRGLIDWTGFKKAIIEFQAPQRQSGEAGYSVFKLARLAMHAFTSFSLFPLKLAGYIGCLFCLCCGLLLSMMVIDRLTINYWGFTNLAIVVVINSLLIGLVLICLGLIALYIGNIHTEVLNRPLYVIRRKGERAS